MARLLNCFLPVIDQIATLAAQIEAGAVPCSAEDCQQVMLDRLAEARTRAELAGYSREWIESATFALAAWFDEVSQQHPAWALQPRLQVRLFHCANGASEFFHHLAGLQPEAAELREVYWMVMAFGFRGQYGHEPQRSAELRMLLSLHGRALPEPPARLRDARPDTDALAPAARHTFHRRGRRRERAMLRTGAALAVLVPALYLLDHMLRAPRLVHESSAREPSEPVSVTTATDAARGTRTAAIGGVPAEAARFRSLVARG